MVQFQHLDVVRAEVDEVLQGLFDDAQEAFAIDLCIVGSPEGLSEDVGSGSYHALG